MKLSENLQEIWELIKREYPGYKNNYIRRALHKDVGDILFGKKEVEQFAYGRPIKPDVKKLIQLLLKKERLERGVPIYKTDMQVEEFLKILPPTITVELARRTQKETSYVVSFKTAKHELSEGNPFGVYPCVGTEFPYKGKRLDY